MRGHGLVSVGVCSSNFYEVIRCLQLKTANHFTMNFHFLWPFYGDTLPTMDLYKPWMTSLIPAFIFFPSMNLY